MTRCADFRRQVKDKNGNPKLPSTNPPIEAVKDVLALDPADWNFPVLESVTESPILRPDGTVLSIPGYDAQCRTIYAPSPDLQVAPIPADPITDEVTEAVALIDEAIGDFPFADASSRANAFAMLLTSIIRRSIDGNAPIALVDAPQAGTGKSLLAEVVSLIHTGSDAAMQPAPARGDETEWRKLLGAVLFNGSSLIVIDNVDHKLQSASLALAVTASTWTDRILGQSKTITLPQKATWIITGNNLQLGGDLPRRCYWIRLDAASSQPWQRTGFRHPDLKKWIRQRRGDLVSALLTLARAWFAVGRPDGNAPTLGSFESWCQTVGGILHYAGVDGFLGNLVTLYQESDPSQLQWEGFLTALSSIFDQEGFTISQLVEVMQTNSELTNARPEEFADCDRKGTLQRRMGRAFAARAGRRYGQDGLHLVKAGTTRNKVVLWEVRAASERVQP